MNNEALDQYVYECDMSMAAHGCPALSSAGQGGLLMLGTLTAVS